MPKDPLDLGYFSSPSLLILFSLVSGPKHGYALSKDIAEFSGTRLEPGTLYGALARLERRGWVEPLPDQDRRRPYRLTAAGLHVLREQLATMQRIVSTGVGRLAAIPSSSFAGGSS
jgi:DNA-binding PadR family transcriptional regulator